MADILQRVVMRIGEPAANVAMDLEAEIRRDWGGDRPYIAKAGESWRIQRTRREEAIRADHRNGAHPSALARKWGVSIRRIQQIIKA